MLEQQVNDEVFPKRGYLGLNIHFFLSISECQEYVSTRAEEKKIGAIHSIT